jgi:diguanylate cyclase (GGDEF)-like protein
MNQHENAGAGLVNRFEDALSLEVVNHAAPQLFRELESLLQRLVAAHKAWEDTIHGVIWRDPLTMQFNRRATEAVLRATIARRARYPEPLAVALADVDHFAEINAEHLHPGGDVALRMIGRSLADSIREVDFLGRYAGDEFVVIFPATDLEGARTSGERLRASVACMPCDYRGRAIHATVSLGFAVVDAESPLDYEAVEFAMSSALHEAKQQGRNRCCFRVIQAPPIAGPD